MKEEEVELGDAVGGPKVCFGWFQDAQGLLQGETLPGSAKTRMPKQTVTIRKVQESVQKPRLP